MKDSSKRNKKDTRRILDYNFKAIVNENIPKTSLTDKQTTKYTNAVK